MSSIEILYEVLRKNNGVITTAQANKIGISNERLNLLVRSMALERVRFGVYGIPNEFIDEMYVSQLRRPKMVYSHETALFLLELSDRDPINYVVTVPTGYNTSRMRNEGMVVYTVKKDLHEIGATQLMTHYGNYVNVYGLERSICDCLRSRNQMDPAIVTDALKRYVRRKEKNLNLLMQMASLFKTEKLLRNYLEVLL